jgi:hypothetical protein
VGFFKAKELLPVCCFACFPAGRDRPTRRCARLSGYGPKTVLAAAEHYGADPLELLRIAYLDGDGPRTCGTTDSRANDDTRARAHSLHPWVRL